MRHSAHSCFAFTHPAARWWNRFPACGAECRVGSGGQCRAFQLRWLSCAGLAFLDLAVSACRDERRGEEYTIGVNTEIAVKSVRPKRKSWRETTRGPGALNL